MGKFISLNNKQVRQVIEYLKNGVFSTDLLKYEQGAFVKRTKKFFVVDDDELYFIGKNNNPKFFAFYNAYAKVEYLTKVHRNEHRGRYSLRFILKENVYGISDKNIMVVLKFCVAFQARKNFNTNPEIIPIKDKFPRDRYIADFVYLADKKYVKLEGGYSYLLTAVDSFLRYTYVAPLKDRSAKTLKFEFEKMFTIIGAPVCLHTDNGKEFVNEKVNGLLDKREVKHVKKNPACFCIQGNIKRYNQLI